MGHRSIGADEARSAIADGDYGIEQICAVPASTDNVINSTLRSLRKEMVRLRAKFPEQVSKKGADSREWEAEASVLVHQHLSDIPLEIQADPGFWSGIALCEFLPFVLWRYNDDLNSINKSNLGIGNPSENLIFRLFKRGEIGYEPRAKDPYRLARYGGIDIWRSHIFRQTYAHAAAVGREIIRIQAGRSPLTTDQVRWLAKELKRLRANIVFEFLSDDDASTMVRAAADRARQAMPRVK